MPAQSHFGYDFSRMRVGLGEAFQAASVSPGALTSTRNPRGLASLDEIHTVNPDAGVTSPDAGTPKTDGGTTPPPASKCSVASGPTYSPTGTIRVTDSSGIKSASFDMAASFNTAAASGAKPSCCEVHQFIKWDAVAHRANSGPPHSGFPSSAAANTWIEDRDGSDKRYGHRSDSHSDLDGGCGDEYKTGTTRDDANGDTYCGNDSPNGASADMKGQYQFRLDAVDTCNSNAVKASSSVITINWT